MVNYDETQLHVTSDREVVVAVSCIYIMYCEQTCGVLVVVVVLHVVVDKKKKERFYFLAKI